ncbi:nucleoside-diphosphate kinase [Pelagibacteraceae bacterium]|nr:nucleoside-diphosphate kinase [Pelagibacteraceae bacterium]
MTIERTFSMIKPDATERNLVGAITAMIESSGLKVIASRRTKMTPEKAAEFYGVHSDRPFFQSLCDFMCSGPIIVQVLEGENAVKKNREIMGATNPEDAEDGTIRKVHAVSLEKNSVHGSDSPENASIEIAHFFDEEEIYP